MIYVQFVSQPCAWYSTNLCFFDESQPVMAHSDHIKYNIKQIKLYLSVAAFFILKFSNNFVAFSFKKLFQIFSIWVEYQTNMFCTLILLPYVKNIIYSMTGNNSITLRQNYMTSVSWNLSTWSQRKKSVIKQKQPPEAFYKKKCS